MMLTANGSAVYLDVLLHGASNANEIIDRTGVSSSTVRRLCFTFEERGYFVQTHSAFELGKRKPELPAWAALIGQGIKPPLMGRDLYKCFEKRLKKLSTSDQQTITGYPPFAEALKVYGRRTR